MFIEENATDMGPYFSWALGGRTHRHAPEPGLANTNSSSALSGHHRDHEVVAEGHANKEAKGYLNKVSTHANARDKEEVDSPQHHHRQEEKNL
jgi:hypothetical protein